jgi:hypothetical protein
VLRGVVGSVRNEGVRICRLSENRNVGVGRFPVDSNVEVIDLVFTFQFLSELHFGVYRIELFCNCIDISV